PILTAAERIAVAFAWGTALNARATLIRDRKRDKAVARLQAKARRLWPRGTPGPKDPIEFARVSAALDRIGRVTRVPVKPPETALPEIDRQIAKQFGVSVRTVERYRSDPRHKQHMPHPVWEEPAWQRESRLRFEAGKQAARGQGATQQRLDKAALIDSEQLPHKQIAVFR